TTVAATPTRPSTASASRGIRIHRERSEEHTSELQSRGHLVCRLVLEKRQSRTSSAQRDNSLGPFLRCMGAKDQCKSRGRRRCCIPRYRLVANCNQQDSLITGLRMDG